MFEQCAEESFGYVPLLRNARESRSKYPWFNRECRNKRNRYHYARRLYNRFKTEHNKNNLKSISKSYKRTMNLCFKRFKQARIDKLKKLKTSNVRAYWKILNAENKNSDCQASLHELYNYFRDINAQETTESGPLPTMSNEELNNEINQLISENEVTNAIKQLHNNKSSGEDNIKNEHIKFTADKMIPIYTKLFNIIFDTAIIPESWSVGVIKPIFKNKGDPTSPENYRPITILSCLGKLFTLILNNRLKSYLEKYDRLESGQAGFRKNHSTANNLFIIKCLIDIAISSKKKLYSCFIDFKQAFDTVWRNGLWHK